MFVAIEGPDGVGKSVLAKALTEGLVRQGLQVTATREPGG
ncbi:MAG: dTMP kinase, partial [Halomonadaceae bacterium]|nr:dTMP kinase [Halomonadaceae bacterium]